MNSSEQTALLDLLRSYSDLKRLKKLQSARNHRYYLRNKTRILAKHKLEHAIFLKSVEKSSAIGRIGGN
jgi:hypothetical protein